MNCAFSWSWFTMDLVIVLVAVYFIMDRLFTFDEDGK